jgi:hypothetical protein
MRPLRARRASAAAFMRLAMLWLIVYDAVWLFARGQYGPGLFLAFFFLLAFGTVQIIGTLRRLAEPRPTYQLHPSPLPAHLQ